MQKLYPTITTTTRPRPLLSCARFALAFPQCKEMEARAESENSLQIGLRAVPENFCPIGRQDCVWQLGSTILQATSPSQRFTCHGSLTHRRAWLTTCNTHRSRTLPRRGFLPDTSLLGRGHTKGIPFAFCLLRSLCWGFHGESASEFALC